MKLPESFRNRACARSALAVVLVVVACGLYAYASGGVQWAFRGSEPADDAAMTATASRVSLAGDAQVVPAGFLLANDQKPGITLAFAKNDRGEDVGEGDFTLLVGDGAKINATHFPRGFKLRTHDFPEDTKGGRLTIHVGYSEIPVDFDERSSVNGHIHPLGLKEIENQGEREIYATWAPKGSLTPYASNKLKIKIDTRGPVLDTVDLVGDPATSVTLVMRFEDDDLKETTAKEREN
jgi:hypothetical protein